jgi:exodeoxyribonuclease V alpha subunit
MQPHTTESAPHERLAGTIERVTFHSEQPGFCVLQGKPGTDHGCF